MSLAFKQDEIIVLLGAGASVEAGVPDASSMIVAIESKVGAERGSWREFLDLYNYVRSAIYYADGLRGVFDEKVVFNIERLVNALEELQKREAHPLYPFVGAWNPRLTEIGGRDFERISRFRKEIVKVLRREWVELERTENAAYYKRLLDFGEEYNFPLRVFSLNYDLCVERTCGLDQIQRGFEDRKWDWRLFDEKGDDQLPILLYKLHGSTDWKWDSEHELTYVDSPATITEEEVAIIFGTAYKLQYVDPFLFFAYELRRWTLDSARAILTVGYGFGDEHINGILGQALRHDKSRRLLAVAPVEKPEEWKRSIADSLGLEGESSEAVVVVNSCASEFFEDTLSLDWMASHFPSEDEEIIPELKMDEDEGKSR